MPPPSSTGVWVDWRLSYDGTILLEVLQSENPTFTFANICPDAIIATINDHWQLLEDAEHVKICGLGVSPIDMARARLINREQPDDSDMEDFDSDDDIISISSGITWESDSSYDLGYDSMPMMEFSSDESDESDY